MLIREKPSRIAITQPAHARIAGSIGRAWGNDQFPKTPVWEDLVYAAAMHDIGYLDWEQRPTLNFATGIPHTFITLPHQEHLLIWENGIRRLYPLSPFASLMTSMHVEGLYRRHFEWDQEASEESRRVCEFLAVQNRWQNHVLVQLQALREYDAMQDLRVRQNAARLLGVWDTLSLLACSGNTAFTGEIASGPDQTNLSDLTATILNPEATRFSLSPWPFRQPNVSLNILGRRLREHYANQESLRSDLDTAPWISIHAEFVPAEKHPNVHSLT